MSPQSSAAKLQPVQAVGQTNKYCADFICRQANSFYDLCYNHQLSFCMWIQQQSYEDLLEILQKGMRVQL